MRFFVQNIFYSRYYCQVLKLSKMVICLALKINYLKSEILPVESEKSNEPA